MKNGRALLLAFAGLCAGAAFAIAAAPQNPTTLAVTRPAFVHFHIRHTSTQRPIEVRATEAPKRPALPLWFRRRHMAAALDAA